jgi:rRNA maturation RNase YbeY
VDPDSRRLRVSVTDGRGRRVRDGGLARWLAAVAPARARGGVAIALVSDGTSRSLNRRFRRTDRATDVLAFPAEASEPAPPRSAERDLGDIAIATGVARRQAREAGHSYEAELRVLALHGLLHLLGYDHHEPKDAARMAREERRLGRRGGVTTGLIGRNSNGHAGLTMRRGLSRYRQRLRPARAANAASARLAGVGPREHKKRLRPERGAGGKRGAAAPPSEKLAGVGPREHK